MGNAWKGVSEDKLVSSEKKMLSYSGLPIESFTFKNVVIDAKGNHVRTIEVGEVLYFLKVGHFRIQSLS